MTEDITELAQSLSLLERKVFPCMEDSILLLDLVKKSKLSEVEVRRALLWLGNRELVKSEVTSKNIVTLLPNGFIAKEFGLPEFRILEKLQSGSKSPQELSDENLPQNEVTACIGILKGKRAIDVSKVDGSLILSITDTGNELLKTESKETDFLKNNFPIDTQSLSESDSSLVKTFSKRKDFMKVVEEKTTTVVLLKKGRILLDANIDYSQVQEQLTAEMLKNGSWKSAKFRLYDVKSRVPSIGGARRNPLREAYNRIRDVCISMGFSEMEGPLVESAFWCMDSMWIPQDHPARDEQDTFFVKGKADLIDPDYVKKVKASHETGQGSGSTGYQKPWNEEKSRQLILRTHSTATTFRKLYELAKNNEADIAKFFYIATNFRNEAIDTTHLAEFQQVEGFIIGDNLNLSHLMGVIKEFYAKLGITKIRFKPTYNPYTEPSMEAHYYDEKKKKWYALINSGIFRPETLAPLGIDKTILAWGIGGSRVASLLNGKNNLRELVGTAVDFDWISKHKTPQLKLD